jgi:DNA helicase-2/ATP-dependent DNA helicase PcrA
MVVATDRRQRDLLFGFQTLITEGITVLDWRTAPLAEVLFGYDEGERYEIEIDGRVVQGTVVEKRLWSFAEGELVRIDAGSTVLENHGGVWQARQMPLTDLSAGARRTLPRHQVTADPTGKRVPIVGDLLDAEQRALLERDPEAPLLILGGAGCGKTTVALHRLARLFHSDKQRFAQGRMVVVVPEQGLKLLTEAILQQLGLGDVGVYTFDAWITRQARRVFTDLPERECEDPPAAVVKLRRHPALRDVLPLLVQKLGREMAERLEKRFPSGGGVGAAHLGDGSAPLLAQLDALEKQVARSKHERQRDEVRKAFAAEKKRLFSARDDLLLLFGDGELLQEAARRSAGELGDKAITATLEHTRLQFADSSERSLTHVDEERRTAVDGLSLDAGTPVEIAETIDIEDYAVCFELLRLKTGGMETSAGRLFTFQHMVLDEAQDLAPIELSVLGRALKPDASLTVCGDRAQHIDPSACFAGWEGALRELGVTGVQPSQLRTSYRCTAAVTRFAHEVLGPLQPTEMPVPIRQGSPVLRTDCATEAHAVYAMAQALSKLPRKEPGVSVAVITRTPEAAERVHRALQRIMPARLVLSGLFGFTPGIDVTPVSQVKGLEFDVVVLPDVNIAGYPADDDARRKLHVAATRAIEQLWVLSPGKVSPLLPVA